jgi:four helix bundle protein
LIDSLSEEGETEVWLDTSKDLGYINKDLHSELLKDYDEVRRMLISMIDHPEKFCH